MRRSVTCYSTSGKRTGHKLLTAFAEGCRGQVVRNARRPVESSIAVFYGVNDMTLPLQRQCIREGRPWIYIDHGYFERDTHYRVVLNRRQHCGRGSVRRPAPVPIQPWRRDGSEVVIALQHPDSYRLLLGKSQDDWLADITASVARLTDREIRVRTKPQMPGAQRPLASDLKNAWCLVSWMSNAAVDAICMGVPAIVLGEDCAARPMAGHQLDQVEDPPRPDGREHWAAVLASNQWTIEEMTDGRCWAELNSTAEDAGPPAAA